MSQLAVAITVSAAEFQQAIERIGEAFDTTRAAMDRMSRAFRAMTRRRRTGHRHLGTRGHRLRYTPTPPGVPLGERTDAKART